MLDDDGWEREVGLRPLQSQIQHVGSPRWWLDIGTERSLVAEAATAPDR
jgi:hypothetical protein